MSGLRFTTVDTGPLRLPRGFMLSLAEGTIEIPTASFIIEHPRQGLVVFDTGLHHSISDPEAAERHFGHGVRDGFGADNVTRAHAIDAQLARLGYRTEDVAYVVYSHLHLDHAGGMMHFPDAIHVVQRDEIRYAWWPDKWLRPIYCHNDIAGARHYDFLEVDGDVDLFLDGSMRLVKTPGHAPGHQMLLLDLPNRGRICLAADLAHIREAYEKSAPMPWDHDVANTSASFMKARAIELAGIPLFFSHETADFETLPRDGQYWD